MIDFTDGHWENEWDNKDENDDLKANEEIIDDLITGAILQQVNAIDEFDSVIHAYESDEETSDDASWETTLAEIRALPTHRDAYEN